MVEPVRESFLFFLRNPRIIYGAEIGVRKGLNALAMLKHCAELKLVLVDNYCEYADTSWNEEYTLKEGIIDKQNMLEALKPYNDRITFLNKDSQIAAKDFPDNHFDYVYIDAKHDEESVTIDLISWYPKVRNGGVLAGHDFCRSGVNTAVKKFFQGKEKISCDGICIDWWIVKKCN